MFHRCVFPGIGATDWYLKIDPRADFCDMVTPTRRGSLDSAGGG
jgi:hypothetical protein